MLCSCHIRIIQSANTNAIELGLATYFGPAALSSHLPGLETLPKEADRALFAFLCLLRPPFICLFCWLFAIVPVRLSTTTQPPRYRRCEFHIINWKWSLIISYIWKKGCDSGIRTSGTLCVIRRRRHCVFKFQYRHVVGLTVLPLNVIDRSKLASNCFSHVSYYNEGSHGELIEKCQRFMDDEKVPFLYPILWNY